jgi:hypothetical protein
VFPFSTGKDNREQSGAYERAAAANCANHRSDRGGRFQCPRFHYVPPASYRTIVKQISIFAVNIQPSEIFGHELHEFLELNAKIREIREIRDQKTMTAE